jgi:uncharacterized protein (TIGR03437 family)
MRRLLYFCALAAGLYAMDSSRTQDLDFVATHLPQLDPNVYAAVDQAVFQQAVNQVRASMDTMTDAQFYVALAKLVAMPGDPHTYLYLGLAPGWQTLPFHLRWLDDGVFVTSAGPEYLRSLGTRVVAINGMPIASVTRLLGTVIPHENDQWLHYAAQTYLVQQQTLEGLGVVPQGEPAAITFQSLDGSEFTLAVSASNEPRTSLISSATGTIPDYLANTSSNYWFSYSAANRLLYFKYNVCQNDPNNPFGPFAESILRTADTNRVDTLVIDFRGNTGGDDSIINPLLLGLEQRIGALRGNPAFALYVVIDKGTFSSAMDDAEVFKQPSLGFGAAVIGEPTGGKPAHYGNVANFALPGSHTPGQYSQSVVSAPSYIPSSDASFEPDIAVAIRSVDYFARFDPVMAAILARWRGSLPPAAGNVAIVNGASFRSDEGVAAGSIAVAFGVFPVIPDAITVAGASAEVLAASASQVNFVVPQSVATGLEPLEIRSADGEKATGQLNVVPASPGIFVLGLTNPQQPGAVENQDSSINTTSNPASVGSVVSIWATGLNQNGPIQVYFGDSPAQVTYGGDAGFGLWQVNAVIPGGTSGITPVFLISNNVPSNAVTVLVQ